MDAAEHVKNSLAMSGLVNITIVLLAIFLAWWSLQQFRFDLFLKNPKSVPGKMLQVLLSIVLGYQTARFVIDYFNWSQLLQGMF